MALSQPNWRTAKKCHCIWFWVTFKIITSLSLLCHECRKFLTCLTARMHFISEFNISRWQLFLCPMQAYKLHHCCLSVSCTLAVRTCQYLCPICTVVEAFSTASSYVLLLKCENFVGDWRSQQPCKVLAAIRSIHQCRPLCAVRALCYRLICTYLLIYILRHSIDRVC